jgi:hypothetical protein
MRSDAEAREEQEDRVIPQGGGTTVCPEREDSLDFLARQTEGEGRMDPLPRDGHGGFEARRELATEDEEAQERADGDTG